VDAIPRLLFEVAGFRDQSDGGVQNYAAPPAEGHGLDRHAVAPEITDPSDRAALADALMATLEARLGRRTVRSFFTVDFAANGYRLWKPGLRAPEDAGTALPRHILETSAGSVNVDLRRYPEAEETHVHAYEWCAELREQPSSELPHAIAYGMAYRFDRRGGIPIAGKWELMAAADCLADVDLLQVNAFFEQHEDADALIDAGDLAFVWLWERRNGARPGAGRECLRAALTDLRRRQRGIRTVVIDLKPYQFVVSDSAGTPTAVHIEKLEAVDRLQSFVDGLHLEQWVNGHCRYIVNRDADNPNAAMRVLGLAGLAQRIDPWQDSG
jgi:hypothetical protein